MASMAFTERRISDPRAYRYPEAYWRSLYLFTGYRLLVGLLLLGSVLVSGDMLQLGSHDRTLFVQASVIYLVSGLVSVAAIRTRWQFACQIAVQVALDIVYITILIYASRGVTSGLGLLLLTTIAGAGLISRGRLSLFYAALASISVLLEQIYEVLVYQESVAQFVQAGFLCIGFFATALVAHARAGSTGRGMAAADVHRPAPALPPTVVELLEPLARLIESAAPALGTDDARFNEQVEALVKAIRDPGTDLAGVKTLLGNFIHRLSFAAEDQVEIREMLLRLLHLVIGNLGDLGLGDNWLKPQIGALAEAATPPLTLRRLDDLERRLKDVMFKQIEAKGRTLDAQEQTRQMLATFIERLAQMADSTSTYQDKMERSARKMEQATSIEEFEIGRAHV